MTIEEMDADKIDRKPPGIMKAIVLPGASGCVLGCLGTLLLGLLAFSLGFCLGPFNTATLGSLAGLVVVLVTAIAFRIKKKNPPWPIFCVEVAVIAFLLVAFFAWDTPRYIFTSNFLSPMPKTIVIKHAHWEPHPMDPSAWIHFKATAQDMAAIIATNNFTMRTDAMPTEPVPQHSGYEAPGWWRPVDLGLNAKLYCRDFYHSQHTGFVSYVVGVWVNTESNEAYGYYISH